MPPRSTRLRDEHARIRFGPRVPCSCQGYGPAFNGPLFTVKLLAVIGSTCTGFLDTIYRSLLLVLELFRKGF